MAERRPPIRAHAVREGRGSPSRHVGQCVRARVRGTGAAGGAISGEAESYPWGEHQVSDRIGARRSSERGVTGSKIYAMRGLGAPGSIHREWPRNQTFLRKGAPSTAGPVGSTFALPPGSPILPQTAGLRTGCDEGPLPCACTLGTRCSPAPISGMGATELRISRVFEAPSWLDSIQKVAWCTDGQGGALERIQRRLATPFGPTRAVSQRFPRLLQRLRRPR